MTPLWEGLLRAIELIITLDPEVMQIAGRSLQFAVTSAVIGSAICVPLGSLIHFRQFRGKRFLVSLIQTFYSVPTVAVGLFVFVFISNAGPLDANLLSAFDKLNEQLGGAGSGYGLLITPANPEVASIMTLCGLYGIRMGAMHFYVDERGEAGEAIEQLFNYSLHAIENLARWDERKTELGWKVMTPSIPESMEL